ncbi:hypothetical protein DEO45_01340 [Rhodanobacter denitrificans]|uniref:Uncharacterized protein n=2 Tax=Rhodanobacter denitrificans TaxID=666685 RepID=A0A368KHG6_9GAMM|nr:hypothetical protein DEO45_01340 [Rhodanobacter denitrificans]
MLNSPLAAATRARVYHQRTRPRPRELGLRLLGVFGALLVHLLFLFGFVLGPAFQLAPPPPSKQQFLQVRLVEPPEPPPPPPVRGTPPKERGPRHQGHASRPVPSREPDANAQAVATEQPAATATPMIAAVAKPKAPAPKPAAAPKPLASLLQPAPTPELQPVPLAGEPPAVTLPTPALQPPVPPKYQPESVRRPQLEGNRAMPPPPSLALPELPAQAAPPIAVSSIALNAEVPRSTAPASVTPARAELPAAPPVPELQPVPLPAQAEPRVNLQAQLSVPAPTVPNEKPQVQAPAIEVAEAELAAVPLAPAAAEKIQPQVANEKVKVSEAARETAIRPSSARPQLSAPATVAETVPAEAAAASHAAAAAPPAEQATPQPAEAGQGRDVSRAPEASAQGSDFATPGANSAAPAENRTGVASRTGANAASSASTPGHGSQPQSGQPGDNQPGATQGERQGGQQSGQQGEPGSYVQLKPRGDTEIMRHSAPNIGYQPTRFEQDWTPEGESSIDTALHRAVDKTKLSHTFHLPRGVRVKCTVMPLLPIALFGCDNPDPPARPVAPKVYDRLHLAPANPPASPASVAARGAPAPVVRFDNAAECATARIAGGPPPPGCEGIVLPVEPAAPAPSSSSWVPASDQFH